jgi:lactate dehydrogenase-like 2-hydroxyacid dehydrogenase
MQKPKVALTRRVFDDVATHLSSAADVTVNASDAPLAGSEMATYLAGHYGVLTTVTDRIDASVLDACPDLRVVANIAVGYNNIDVPACTARGIKVTNTPGVLDETTADLTWALLMATARRIVEGDRYVREGQWKVAFGMEQMLGTDIHGKTLGILGMGRIGQAIARRARGFGMTVLYHNRTRLDDVDQRTLGVRWVEKNALFVESDFLLPMLPYSLAAHHIIGAAELALMKPSSILVNTARGGIVDDAALVAALKAGTIAAAGVDVFEGEPTIHAGYLDLPNVVLTPHVGSATRATRVAMAMTAANNMLAALRGEAPPNWVNR